jgi:hypothetical protein
MEYESRYEVKKWNFRFDFDIGYLVKSPCRDCDLRDALPHCSDTCELIDRIHTILSESICSSRRR